jgi:hypothetical protein
MINPNSNAQVPSTWALFFLHSLSNAKTGTRVPPHNDLAHTGVNHIHHSVESSLGRRQGVAWNFRWKAPLERSTFSQAFVRRKLRKQDPQRFAPKSLALLHNRDSGIHKVA